ncbi:granzyme A [Haliaeetus albicilla]|uniref:granzyme A n=1 Tax=Haliaeetus albicilla TaxID=8969 RepID=UPI0005228994|nr:PREDICTED: granzyme A [Haliaeetus albicilla]XP_010578901.1 PREDICTED: granzyme A-like [Haliaeetus leucocephalus]
MGPLLALSTFAAVILLVIHAGLCVDIIGGNEVAPHSRPFMVLINNANGKFICGGALIKKNWVLTAAHCNVEGGEVILGAHSRKENEREKQVIQIAKQIRYPRYHSDHKENDIMLLQLKKRARLNKAVQLIPLPTSDDDPKPGTTCTVAGWGQTRNYPKKPSDTLREVNITVISREICNDNHHYKNNPVITENMICAGAKNGGKDSCSGDSGGPLRCKNVMRGITAFGKANKCGTADAPGVYTRLTNKYLQWIRKTIGGA